MKRTIIIELDWTGHVDDAMSINQLPSKLHSILESRSSSTICTAPEDDDFLRNPSTGRIVGHITTCIPKDQPSLPGLLRRLLTSGRTLDDSFTDSLCPCCPHCAHIEGEGEPHPPSCALNAIVSTLTPTHPE